MKRIIRHAAWLLCLSAGWAGVGCATTGRTAAPASANCCSNKDLYDRCYPERYNNLAQRSVNLAHTPQVQNGHVLDQTVWNHHFERGTDRLTPGGLAQLQYVSRRRPQPDGTIYLATALDLEYDPACPERYAGAAQELNALRLAAVQKYLIAVNAGRPMDFQVLVHDPADVTLNAGVAGGASPVTTTLGQMNAAFRGGIGSSGGGTAGASGGGTSGGSGR